MSGKHSLINTLPRELDLAKAIAARYADKPDALLEILHDLRHELGSIPEAALPVLAMALNLSRAEVHGVIGKTEPWPCGLPCTKAGDVCASLAGNVDFVFIKTQLSLGFRWNS